MHSDLGERNAYISSVNLLGYLFYEIFYFIPAQISGRKFHKPVTLEGTIKNYIPEDERIVMIVDCEIMYVSYNEVDSSFVVIYTSGGSDVYIACSVTAGVTAAVSKT